MAKKKAKNGRKKARSAKQKANDKRLGQMAKRNARRVVTPKKRKSSPKRKVNKQRRRKANVVKRKTTPKKKSFLGNIPVINNPLFRKAAAGVGTAAIGGAILALVVPSLAAQPLVKPVLALAGGGVAGVVAQIVTQGGLSGLGLGGGGASSPAASNIGNIGFA